jgi:hypothetical protein
MYNACHVVIKLVVKTMLCTLSIPNITSHGVTILRSLNRVFGDDKCLEVVACSIEHAPHQLLIVGGLWATCPDLLCNELCWQCPVMC